MYEAKSWQEAQATRCNSCRQLKKRCLGGPPFPLEAYLWLDRTCGLDGCYVLAEYNSDDLDELGELSPCGSSVQLDGLIRRGLSEPNTDQVDRPTRRFVSIDSAADGAGYGRRRDQSLRWICFRICFSSCA